jgi:phosphatidylserine synthase
MKKGVYLLPTSLTLCSMFFGFYSILASLKGNYIHAAWAIMIATIFDGLDGWVARLTHTTTKFGIELDSLSDQVGTFSFRENRMGSGVPVYGLWRPETCKIQYSNGIDRI